MVFLLEVSRHGARTPSVLIPGMMKDPADDFQIPKVITPYGQSQCEWLGQYVRTKYVEEKQFLSPEYDPSEIYV